MDVLKLLLLILSVLSHVGMSIFFAKPRYNKLITALIWLVYAVVFLVLPPATTKLNYTFMLLLNAALFFIATKGKPIEKGFLFISYASIYTAFGAFASFIIEKEMHIAAKIVFTVLIMAVLQILLYIIILPKYKKVSVYIGKGFGKYYAIVSTFLLLTALQTIYIDGVTSTDNGRFQIFVATTAVFFVTYAALFSSLKDMVELAKEKRKQIHTELLKTQVQAQENEVMWARKSYHDIRHHNDAILALAKTGDLDSIIRYLEKQNVEMDGQHNERFCENETINNVLRVYRAKAKASNIRFSADAAAKKETPVSSHDLVAILANVVENALHGAIESNAEDPMISVNIYYKAKKMVIVCENSCNPHLVFAPDMPSEMWGVGIHSIVSTAEKYGGTCRFTAQNGVFTATVAFIS
jgi:hypothetical protein